MIGVAVWLCLVAGLPRAPEAETPAPKSRTACFVPGYPGLVCSADDDAHVLCDGRRLAWDDGLGEKDYARFLEAPDLEETVRMRYRPGPDFPVPPVNFEPGRIRHEALFRALYGADRAAIERQLVDVKWMPRRGGTSTLRVHQRVAAALQAVSDELERALPEDEAALAATTAGAFYYRKVRGTQRTSMHAFGIAIDVGVKRSDYWDWQKPKDGRYRWRNRFPWAIAEVFERHGFVWGAKWYHFDTMHFEYRPELFAAPCVDGDTKGP